MSSDDKTIILIADVLEQKLRKEKELEVTSFNEDDGS